MGLVISSLGTWGLGGNRGGALHQELPQGSPCPAWPRGAFWGSFHISPPILTPLPPPSKAGHGGARPPHLLGVTRMRSDTLCM